MGAASPWWHRELWADWAGALFVAVLLLVNTLAAVTTPRYDPCTDNGAIKTPCNRTDPA